VLRAATAIADKEGIDAVTMRAVSQRLKAEPMSLYRHVRNKEDILDGLVDLVFAEIELPPRGALWKTAMRRRARSAREVLRRHPWAIVLMESRARPGPANLRHHDAVLGTLRAGGFTSLGATRAYNLVNSYIYGFALQEASLPFGTPEEMARMAETTIAQISAEEYPHLREAAFDLVKAGFDYAGEFDAGLDLVLDGVERMRASVQMETTASAVRTRGARAR
jgi:AcrR family transcriptional regulator